VGLFSFQYRVANVGILINVYILIEQARKYRTEVRACPSGKSVGPKFLSSNGVLAHSRIAEGVWSKISNALKRLGLRSRNFLT